MTNISKNTNDPSPNGHGRGHESQGLVAMLLVESLIHGLIARSIIDAKDAVEIVAIATEVIEETAIESGNTTETMAKSLAILEAICSSLSIDLPKGPDGLTL